MGEAKIRRGRIIDNKGFRVKGGTYCPSGNNHSATRSRTATLL